MELTSAELLDLCLATPDYTGSYENKPEVIEFANRLNICRFTFTRYIDAKPMEDVVLIGENCKETGSDIRYFSYNFQSNIVIKTTIYRSPNAPELSEDDENYLSFFSELVMISISRYHVTQVANYYLYNDPMTKLSNIVAFTKNTSQVIAEGNISMYTAAYINIKNFRVVNRIFGSAIGDEILKQFANEFSMRFDPTKNECFARLGGDNFCMLARNEHVNEILDLFNAIPIEFEYKGDHISYTLQVRAGILPLDSSCDNCSKILGMCSATYSLSRNPQYPDILYYNESINDILNSRDELENAMANDLKSGKFLVYYQPKVKVNDDGNTLCGAEALIRWRREDRMVPPKEFIPIAESNGFIRQIDFFVLETVCNKICLWQAQGINVVPISCNFSKIHLSTKNLASQIIDIIDKHHVDHSLIEIEFTETAYHDEYESLIYAISELKSAGISVSMDDFGTGYSSLALLKDLDFDCLKIDKSLVNDSADKSNKILKCVIDMANILNMKVICEGVNNITIINNIKSMGCNIVQSDIFDKAMSERYFENRLKSPKYMI